MKHLLPFLILFTCLSVKAQNAAKDSTTQQTTGKDTIYTFAQKPPQYPDGDDKLMKFLDKASGSYKGPKNIHGHVILRFVITEDGSVTNATITRSLDAELDEEAKRIIYSLPKKFLPAYQNGNPVKIYFTVPVTF